MDIKGAEDGEDEGDDRSEKNTAEEDDDDDDDDDELVVRLDGDDFCVSADETIIVNFVFEWEWVSSYCVVQT